MWKAQRLPGALPARSRCWLVADEVWQTVAGLHALQASPAKCGLAAGGQDVNGALSTTRFCGGGAMPDWKRDETQQPQVWVHLYTTVRLSDGTFHMSSTMPSVGEK